MNLLGMCARLGLLLIGCLGSWSIAEAKVVYVAKTGSDANDGLSWATAKGTVQAGLTTATAGDEVWVAAGTYVECITLTAEVALYGGFTGSETDRSQRDWKVNATVLDGNAAGSVVKSPSAATSATRIDGFTIRNGKAAYGGGICCYSYSSPIIANNAITANIAASIQVGYDGGPGGGIYCGGGSPMIVNNTITGNGASGTYGRGGGICCTGWSAVITNNTIAGNNASVAGGGIGCTGGSTAIITNNTITSNNASNGGGIYCQYSTFPTITNTIIAFNSSGIYKSTSPDTPILRYNCVYSNTAYDYSGLTAPTGTNGSISVDPSFVRTPSPGADGQWATADDDPGDSHLKAGSPCIDAGDNAAVPAGVLTDLGGVLRFFDDPATADTGSGTAPIVDMGAYEYNPGDYDRDGDIDADDMKAFAACISGPAIPYTGDCAGSDFDRDGDVDQSDFGFVQRRFSGAGKAVDPACAR